MGIFSNLFGSSRVNSADNVDINSSIAEVCLRGIGYSSRDESISYSILGTANSQKILSSINFTENYFYEELPLYIMSVIELQERCLYIDRVIEILSLERELADNVDHNKIMTYLKLVGAEIAIQRIKKQGFSVPKNSLQIAADVNNKLMEYGELLLANVQCNEPMGMANSAAGLSPRDHPLKIYLGKISDNIANSLNISCEDVLTITKLELSILHVYGLILKVGQDFISMKI